MNALRVSVLMVCALVLSACGSYTLRGRVIAGEASYIVVVDADDPALEGGVGLGGAHVTLSTDPERINREVVGSAVSGPDGFFETPFDKVGGGLLEYDAGVRVSRAGHQSAEHFFRLPGKSKRLLVVLAPGRDSSTSREEDPYEQYKRYRRE